MIRESQDVEESGRVGGSQGLGTKPSMSKATILKGSAEGQGVESPSQGVESPRPMSKSSAKETEYVVPTLPRQ